MSGGWESSQPPLYVVILPEPHTKTEVVVIIFVQTTLIKS